MFVPKGSPGEPNGTNGGRARAGALACIRRAVAERAGADFPCIVKVPAEVSVFPDTTLSRGDIPDSFWSNPGIAERLRRAAPTRTRRAVIKIGAWWGGRRAPFAPVWNRELFTAASRTVGVPVLAVGGIRTAAEVRQILDDGEADLVGIGRPFYAEPDLAARILGGDESPGRCRSSNRCVAAQMLGMRGVCYNPEVTKRGRAAT